MCWKGGSLMHNVCEGEALVKLAWRANCEFKFSEKATATLNPVGAARDSGSLYSSTAQSSLPNFLTQTQTQTQTQFIFSPTSGPTRTGRLPQPLKNVNVEENALPILSHTHVWGYRHLPAYIHRCLRWQRTSFYRGWVERILFSRQIPDLDFIDSQELELYMSLCKVVSSQCVIFTCKLFVLFLGVQHMLEVCLSKFSGGEVLFEDTIGNSFSIWFSRWKEVVKRKVIKFLHLLVSNTKDLIYANKRLQLYVWLPSFLGKVSLLVFSVWEQWSVMRVLSPTGWFGFDPRRPHNAICWHSLKSMTWVMPWGVFGTSYAIRANLPSRARMPFGNL